MKKLILAVSIFLAGTSTVCLAAPPDRPIRLVLSRRSTVDPSLIVKHLSEKCPNVSLTTNRQRSDFMLNAWGWSGDYRFMVIAKGGDTIYATQTALLSNAVKDVCHFLNKSAPEPDSPY